MVQRPSFAMTEVKYFLFFLTWFAHTAARTLNIHTDLLEICQVLGLSQRNTEFQQLRFFIRFRSRDGLGHSRTLICFLRNPVLGFPGCVPRFTGMLDLPTTHLQSFDWEKETSAQNLTINMSVVLSTVQKNCPKPDVSYPHTHSKPVVHGMVLILLLPPNMVSGGNTKGTILILSDHMTFTSGLLWINPYDHWQMEKRQWRACAILQCNLKETITYTWWKPWDDGSRSLQAI